MQFVCGAATATGHRPHVHRARPRLHGAVCWPMVWPARHSRQWRSRAANARCQTANCFDWRQPCRAQCPTVCGVVHLGPSARRHRPATCRVGRRRALLGQNVRARRPLQTGFATPHVSRVVAAVAAKYLVLAPAVRCAAWCRPRCRAGGAGHAVERCVKSDQTPHGCVVQSWPCRAPSP